MNSVSFVSVGKRIRPKTSEYSCTRVLLPRRTKFKSIATNTEEIENILPLTKPAKEEAKIPKQIKKIEVVKDTKKILKNLTPKVRLKFYLPETQPHFYPPRRSICHLLSYL